MNTQLLRKFLLFFILLTVSGYTLAKEYVVEVVIFANNHGKSQIGNYVPAMVRIPPPSGGVNLLQQKSVSIPVAENSNVALTWLLLGPESAFLGGPSKRIQSSGNYTLLKHFSWRQPAVPKRNALALQIYAGKDYSSQFPRHEIRQTEFGDGIQSTVIDGSRAFELEGTIKVSVSRYLHVYTDLVYRLPRKDPQTGETLLVDYPIRSHRRMRSNELHYIDHPLVGILIEARPVEN